MYISCIRPVLEYSSFVWDGCSEQDKMALERRQNETARTVTSLTKFSFIFNLYKECGWASLADKRYLKQNKMCI